MIFRHSSPSQPERRTCRQPIGRLARPLLTVLLLAIWTTPLSSTLAWATTGDNDHVGRTVDTTAAGSTEPVEKLSAGEAPKKGRDTRASVADGAGWLENLRKTALVYGASLGWRWEAVRINETLKRDEHSLDMVFDFTPFMLSGHVLVPAIDASNNNFYVQSPSAATAFAKRFRIIEPARIVSIPPSWREFLLLDVPPTHKVAGAIMPRNSKERKIWRKGVKDGWAFGAALADKNETIGLRELRRSVIGRVRYMELLHNHMVSPPRWAVANEGTKRTFQDLTIGRRVTLITQPTLFRPESSWQPEVEALVKQSGVKRGGTPTVPHRGLDWHKRRHSRERD